MNSFEYSQLYGILVMLGNRYFEKIPDSVIDTIVSRMDKENIPQYEINSISEIPDISENVRKIINIFNQKYWKIM